MTPATIVVILKLIDAAFLGVSTVAQARAKARLLAEQLRAFEGSDPDDADWDAINEATDEKMTRLAQRAFEARNASGI